MFRIKQSAVPYAHTSVEFEDMTSMWAGIGQTYTNFAILQLPSGHHESDAKIRDVALWTHHEFEQPRVEAVQQLYGSKIPKVDGKETVANSSHAK